MRIRKTAAAAVAGLLTFVAIACADRPRPEQNPRPATQPWTSVRRSFTAEKVRAWETIEVEGKPCLASPKLSAGSGNELNHHRVTVACAGDGIVEASIAHGDSTSLEKVLASRHRRRPFRRVASGKRVKITTPYAGQRNAWLLLRVGDGAKVQAVQWEAWRGEKTLYGHEPKAFEFAGAKLPYRLMYPRDYDPARSYPLVISVHGSGGIGTGNRRSMEMVILARYLFTRYYDEPEMACFSLVPQIPPNEAIPEPYWPRGKRGAPDRYHPDWPAVNENGWYTQATLALIESLKKDESVPIDPDRVYYTGFSYGGKACWEFLKGGREVFAGAICVAGWPIGRAFSRPNEAMLGRLKKEVARYKHIPVRIYAGEKDRLRFGSEAVHRLLKAAGGDSQYVELPGAAHVDVELKHRDFGLAELPNGHEAGGMHVVEA
jgi:dienelactone hydrolase